jgi:anaerobic ribonucleoside-triphosphate reductase activating protein
MFYHEIKTDNMLNGESLRVVLWISGCSLKCPHCFNPQTWDFTSGKPFDEQAMQTIIKELNKPYIKGLTITGGNPLEPQNWQTIKGIIHEVHRVYNPADKDIWVYTGYTWEELTLMTRAEYYSKTLGDELQLFPMLVEIDVLADGRYVEALKDVNYPYVGSTNQRLIDTQKSIEQDSAKDQYLNGDAVVLYQPK